MLIKSIIIIIVLCLSMCANSFVIREIVKRSAGGTEGTEGGAAGAANRTETENETTTVDSVEALKRWCC